PTGSSFPKIRFLMMASDSSCTCSAFSSWTVVCPFISAPPWSTRRRHDGGTQRPSSDRDDGFPLRECDRHRLMSAELQTQRDGRGALRGGPDNDGRRLLDPLRLEREPEGLFRHQRDLLLHPLRLQLLHG